MASAYESIVQGLQEAIDLSEGKPVAAKIHKLPPVDVAETRHSLGLTQIEFASKLHVPQSIINPSLPPLPIG